MPTLLNRANDRWVEETRFLSRLLVDLLTDTGHLLHRMWTDADLDQLGESGGLVSKQLLSGWMWRATTAKTGFTTNRSATPSNGQG